VAGPGELLGRSQPRRSGPDDRDRAAGRPLRRLRLNPALVPGPVDDRDLDLLDGHRVAVDAQHAGALARRRAQPAGELREVVGRVQPLDRFLPVVPPGQVVPLRDQVAQRTAVVAERDAAVHAAPGLPLELAGVLLLVDLLPVQDPHVDRTAGRQLALRGGEEALRVSHGMPP
jgi:hypothetical protein